MLHGIPIPQQSHSKSGGGCFRGRIDDIADLEVHGCAICGVDVGGGEGIGCDRRGEIVGTGILEVDVGDGGDVDGGGKHDLHCV